MKLFQRQEREEHQRVRRKAILIHEGTKTVEVEGDRTRSRNGAQRGSASHQQRSKESAEHGATWEDLKAASYRQEGVMQLAERAS